MEELRDELVRTHCADAGVSVRVLAATNLVREAVKRHATAPPATVALGRALMGTLLLATEAKHGERVQLQLRGDGPLGSITVTADSEGLVRGYVQHPQAEADLDAEHLGVSRAIGLGTLTVERNHPSWKRPYSGIVPIVEGEIAQDLARYLLESEQKPSAVALGIYLGRDAAVEAAGGYLIQSLPGADDAALAELEQRVAHTENPSELLRNGASADAILERLVDGVGTGETYRMQPRFHCPCSIERVVRATLLLGREEIREIVRTGEVLEVRCAFCAEVYRVPPDELGSALPDS